MRYFFLLVVAVALMIPCAGCGGKPDPRDNPDFIEDPNPDAALEGMGGEDTGPDAAKP